MIKQPTGFPRLLESPEFFFLKIPGPGKSWKITCPGKSWKSKLKVLESPGRISLKVIFLVVQMENKQQ